MSQLSSEHDRENEIDAIVADYLERIDRGERVSHEQLIDAHPALADTLREFFAAEQAMGNPPARETAARDAHPTLQNALRIRCPIAGHRQRLRWIRLCPASLASAAVASSAWWATRRLARPRQP